MKTLYSTLNEGILDIDFDVEDQTVYAVSVKDVLIELIEHARKYEPIADCDSKFEEVVSLLSDISKEQRADKTSVMKKLRMKDNTAIWALKVPYTDASYKIVIRRFVENPRPMEITLTMGKWADGSCHVSCSGPYKVNHLSNINPQVAKTMAFMNKNVWDELLQAMRG